MDERLLIGIVHLDVRHGAVAENRARLLRYTQKAAAEGARIIVAPELALSGYSFESISEVAPFTEELAGETVKALSRISRRFGVYLCTGLAEHDKKTGLFYNSAVVLGPDGRIRAHHRKHVAERRWSCPGQPSSSSIFETPWGKVGVLICADTYYGLLPRSMALEEADLLLVCANWPPSGLNPREVWRARALENGVGVVAANRTGIDRRMDCREAPSYAVTPEGRILLDQTSEDNRLFLVEYPLERHRFPCRLREEMEALRRPWDYNAIALDVSGMDDFPGMWGLPVPGSLDVRCYIPPTGQAPTAGLPEEATASPERSHTLLLLPPAMRGLPLPRLLGLVEGKPLAIVTESPSFGGGPSLTFFSDSRVVSLSPGMDSTMVDFGPVRIGLARSKALRHPETAVALSKQGCDLLVTQTDSLGDDDRLVLGIKSLERTVVAVAARDGATICEPPEGHERWRETLLREPGICSTTIDTGRTRKKRFLDRVDMEVLLSR